jgi:hypothetical protein
MLVSMAGGAFIVSRLPGRAADRPDLVLIVLDTVRYDRTSLPPGVEPGSNSDTTPFLRELASRGIAFTRARAPAEWTLPSHASMFTGLLPSRHFAHYDHRYLADDAPTLAEWLSARGYVTAAFSANPNVSRAFNFDQGFDHFFEAFREEETIAHGSKSGAILAALGKWVSEQRQGPRFVFVNLMDAHLPYAADSAHLDRFAPRGGALDAADLAAADFLDRVVAGERPLDDEFVAALKERYDAALRTVDDRLRQVVELLERRGVLGKNSLLVVTSDHGERLGEDGRVDHQGSLSEVLLRVPLVFVGRGATGGVRNDTPIGLESIAGHLSGAALDGFRPSRIGAGTPLVAERFPAYPILDRIRARWPALDLEEFAHQEWAIVDPAATFKLCVRDDGRERLYRLAPVGVGETLVEDGQESAMRTELRAGLARHRERSRPLKERFAPERFERGDADLEDELAALAQSGYTATAARGATSIHAQVHLERGNRAFAAGDLESARRDYLGAADLDPRFPAPLFNLAIVAERLSAPLAERIDAWERYLAAALKSDSEDRAKLEQAYGRLEALRAAPSR